MNIGFIETHSFRAEAQRYCDEHDITDAETCQRVEDYLRHRAFLRAIEPYQREKAKLYGFRYLKRITLGATPAETETEYEWVSPAPKMLAQYDELIAHEAARYALQFPERR